MSAVADPRLPTFLLAGAGKSGTSTLARWLEAHPEVGMASLKEPGFFSREPGWRDGGPPHAATQSGRFELGLDWYRELFAGREGARARGEASTIYMPARDAPELIAEVVPDVRLLFILRDPVARLYSHYWQERRHWRLPAFAELVESRHPRFERYLEVSRYDRHLERFLDRFPRDRVVILLHDDLVADPEGLAERLWEVVGVSPGFRPPAPGRRVNAARAPRVALVERLLGASLGRRWVSAVPGWLRRPVGRLRRGLSRLNSRAVRYPPLDPDLRAELVDELGDTISRIEVLLDRGLPSWRAE